MSRISSCSGERSRSTGGADGTRAPRRAASGARGDLTVSIGDEGGHRQARDGALSGGHFAVDFASGSVPALIPFLTDKFDLNYALAATLLLVATVSSSVVQPIFGLWSDRRGALWLIPGGAALAAVGVGLRRSRRSIRSCCCSSSPAGSGSPRSTRGREVRRLRERPQAGGRHVVLQHRRQLRATRSARS